ncbi:MULTISPECIES: rhomboid family intramembrane serine protease [Kosmotoga]|jgi:membrane associated rhomboid family serine protease|uniref:Rhomboid family protein n=1 Tax=Kosmotoga olearia (strain ATCC BAA-1733 / DSM 21960 / TBF 19.5.1) TaxID=521045 RepID=C5CDZ2_KOSOT|nr:MULTISPECIES: rhomboid family intramembrane serine protease [Kosmotoga]ACR80094.1 Rhomboid family protein [Kosmotoga olearia TBF 19.5.1]MDI3523626.1 hypothetical protein [Kosmotoga sp.]MDK2953518.1 hypothetical protein [Kosmotoga sp.]OAA20443.1 peptidase S54 [Kosmotoga sp. DU53]
MFPLRDTIPSEKKPYVMWTIILINVGVFLYELLLSDGELLLFMYRHGLVPSRYTKGYATLEPYYTYVLKLNRFNLFPFVTSIFLHGGWTHIIGNMWTLWVFGDNVEDRLGHFRFLLYYLSWGIAANLFQFLVAPISSTPIIGASGAIAGVMGAYLFFFPWSRILTFIPIFIIPFIIEIPAFIFLIIWFTIQFFNGTLSIVGANFSGVAWWAHIGGFLVGLYMAKRFETKYPGYWYR